jgi:uncharacterized protein
MAQRGVTDFTAVYQDVEVLLGGDTSGHGIDHVDRVLNLAITFAEKEGADKEIVMLAALLHDVDDYKVFGEEHAEKLLNAHAVLDTYGVSDETKRSVLHIIRSMGYNKYLEGIRPDTLEGMIVSDADMCDAIGSIGILRTHAYALSKRNVFFDKDMQPEDESINVAEYKVTKKSHSVQHFFDKLLRIPAILMTDAGRAEGEKRKTIMVSFLRELFQEENSQGWLKYLNTFESKG